MKQRETYKQLSKAKREELWRVAKKASCDRQKIARSRGEDSDEAKRAWMWEQEAWRKVGL